MFWVGCLRLARTWVKLSKFWCGKSSSGVVVSELCKERRGRGGKWQKWKHRPDVEGEGERRNMGVERMRKVRGETWVVREWEKWEERLGCGGNQKSERRDEGVEGIHEKSERGEVGVEEMRKVRGDTWVLKEWSKWEDRRGWWRNEKSERADLGV